MEEKELFEDYEIKSWDFSPRLFKVFGASTLITILTVVTFGQFNLIQSRACDNGIVGQMCQVLDAVYIATVLGGNDKQWGVSEYDENRIEDAEVIMVDVSGAEPKLQYPEGYFAVANPENYNQTVPNQNDMIGQIPGGTFNFPPSAGFPPAAGLPSASNSGSGDLLSKSAELPKANNDPLKGRMPDSPFGSADDAPKIKIAPGRSYNQPARRPKAVKTPKLPNNSPKKLPGDETLAGNTGKKPGEDKPKTEVPPVDPSNLTSDRINKKPLQDFAEDIVVKTDGAEKLDLTKQFAVEMSGVLGADGKLDLKKSRFRRGDGDPQMVDVAKLAIEAINNSGILSYLKDFGVERVNFVLLQDDKQITAVITADQPSEEKARTLLSGLNAGIMLAKMTNKDEDLKSLIDAAKLTAEGKTFTMNFALPKEIAHKLIDKKLQEARAKKLQPTGSEAASNASPAVK